jgi:ATP-binding cassette subfamily B multidrug efflux pump
MDRIIVLDDGKLIEQGTHKELLKADGLYAKLWSHQSGGFISE